MTELSPASRPLRQLAFYSTPPPTSMGFLRDQRTKWRTRLQSRSDDDDVSDVGSSLETVVFPYAGGPLGLTLQRSKSKWIDDIGPTKIAWCKDRRLGITFHERQSDGVDHVIAVKELTDDARNHPTICVGMELIGVNGERIAGFELATVMDMLRNSKSPCELAFTPPPSPILVAEVSATAASYGIASNHVLVAVDGIPMLGCSLHEASVAISAATQYVPVTLQFAPLHVVFRSHASEESSPDAVKKSLRNTLCIAAVAAALTV